jgi:hypothetical protein
MRGVDEALFGGGEAAVHAISARHVADEKAARTARDTRVSITMAPASAP